MPPSRSTALVQNRHVMQESGLLICVGRFIAGVRAQRKRVDLPTYEAFCDDPEVAAVKPLSGLLRPVEPDAQPVIRIFPWCRLTGTFSPQLIDRVAGGGPKCRRPS